MKNLHKMHFTEEELLKIKGALDKTICIEGFPRATAYKKVEKKLKEIKGKEKNHRDRF